MLDMKDYLEILDLYSDYSACLDAGEFEKWPEFFLDECEYRIQPRENHERKLPLSTLWLESKNMLKDRVYGVRQTLFHDPYYQRHVVSAPRIKRSDGNSFESEANYLVIRTKRDQFSEVYNTGRYIDSIQRTPEGLRFRSRQCIFDSEMIRNSIIYPI